MLAAASADLKVVNFVLDTGAPVNQPDRNGGLTALHAAAADLRNDKVGFRKGLQQGAAILSSLSLACYKWDLATGPSIWKVSVPG